MIRQKIKKMTCIAGMMLAAALTGCGNGAGAENSAAEDVVSGRTVGKAEQPDVAAGQTKEESSPEQEGLDPGSVPETASEENSSRESNPAGQKGSGLEQDSAGQKGSGLEQDSAGQKKAGLEQDPVGQKEGSLDQDPAGQKEGSLDQDPADQYEETENVRKEPPEGWELTLASEDWGLGFGESGTQPVGNASAEDLAWYDAYYLGADTEKVIYLTFDCGYENGNTEPILDALKEHDVQATFFVVGHYLETAPDLVKRMVEEGHAVGNHTYHHLDMPTISDQATFRKEMDDVAALFREVTGTELSPYYRPPQGKCNVENLKMAQELGYRTIFWSLAYVDWDTDKQPSHEEAFDKLTTRIHPGAIVLLHNTSQTNGEILNELLTKWEKMGYTFRPLSDLTEAGRG